MNRLTIVVVSLAVLIGTTAGVALGLRDNGEQATTAKGVAPPPGPRPGPVTSADVGGSRAGDLVLIDNGADRTFTSVSKGGIGAPKEWAATSYGNAKVVRGDFTGDGWADLALVEHDRVRIAASTGAVFSEPVSWGEFEQPDSFQVTAGDFDGDGRTDLAIASGDGSVFVSVRVLLARKGRFVDGGEWRRIDRWTLANLSLGSGDVDGDGDADLIEMGIPDPDARDVDVRVLMSDRNGFAKDVGWFLAKDWRWDESRMVVGDVDGDGSADLVVMRGQGSRSFDVLLSRGDAFVPNGVLRLDGTAGAHLTPVASDVDGDGRTDVVLVDGSAGRARLLRSTGERLGDRDDPVDLAGGGRDPLVIGSSR